MEWETAKHQDRAAIESNKQLRTKWYIRRYLLITLNGQISSTVVHCIYRGGVTGNFDGHSHPGTPVVRGSCLPAEEKLGEDQEMWIPPPGLSH